MKYSLLFIFFISLFASCSSNKTLHKSPEEEKAELYYDHGTEKLVNKRYTEALKYFLKAEKLQPKNPKIQNNLGMTYWFKKQSEKAVYHLKKAIENDENDGDARNNLASVYYQKKKYDLALLEYRKVATNLIYDHQYRVLYNMALIYGKKGDQEKMIEYLNLSLKEKNDYCPTHFKLGRHYFSTKRFIKSFDHFHQSSLGTCLKNPAPFYWKAKTLAASKRYFKAKQEYRHLIKSFPRSHYSKLAVKNMSTIRKQELLSERVREQNYRYQNHKNSLQSKKRIEEPLDLETPDF